jgi:hypothetical protein
MRPGLFVAAVVSLLAAHSLEAAPARQIAPRARLSPAVAEPEMVARGVRSAAAPAPMTVSQLRLTKPKRAPSVVTLKPGVQARAKLAGSAVAALSYRNDRGVVLDAAHPLHGPTKSGLLLPFLRYGPEAWQSITTGGPSSGVDQTILFSPDRERSWPGWPPTYFAGAATFRALPSGPHTYLLSLCVNVPLTDLYVYIADGGLYHDQLVWSEQTQEARLLLQVDGDATPVLEVLMYTNRVPDPYSETERTFTFYHAQLAQID